MIGSVRWEGEVRDPDPNRKKHLTLPRLAPLASPTRRAIPVVAVGGNGLLTLVRDQTPAIEHAFGMLHRLAKRKPVTITEMRAAVHRRAKKKYPAKPA